MWRWPLRNDLDVLAFGARSIWRSSVLRTYRHLSLSSAAPSPATKSVAKTAAMPLSLAAKHREKTGNGQEAVCAGFFDKDSRIQE
jgi:hypothetical protein